MLNPAGIVVACNQALLEHLHRPRPEVVGEPLLGWIARASERAAFGRAFMGMRPRLPGHRFSLEISIAPALGRPLPCLLRACKLASDNVLVTCEPEQGERIPEMEMGRALTRGLEALDHGLLLLDGQGRIVHANPAARELFAPTRTLAEDPTGAASGGGLLGRSLLELADPEGARTLSQGMSQARAGNWHGELDLRRLDGEIVAVELSLAAGRGEGSPMVALIRDLRERRLREFEARLAAQGKQLLYFSCGFIVGSGGGIGPVIGNLPCNAVKYVAVINKRNGIFLCACKNRKQQRSRNKENIFFHNSIDLLRRQ